MSSCALHAMRSAECGVHHGCNGDMLRGSTDGRLAEERAAKQGRAGLKKEERSQDLDATTAPNEEAGEEEKSSRRRRRVVVICS